MRVFSIAIVAFAMLVGACASSSSTDAGSGGQVEAPTSTSAATTIPTTIAPVTTSPVTTSPVTTSPVTTSETASPDESTPSSEGQDQQTGSTEEEPTVTTQPPKAGIVKPIQPVEPHSTGPVAAAIADLATRLGVDESQVTLVSQEEVTWPDGSLGCPQPGMRYTQVLVNGSLIVLEVNGTTYEYHSGGGGDPFYCTVPTDPTSGGVGDA